MNTLNQLLRAIITHPEADDPRLMYADALDELSTQTTTRKCTMCVDGKQNDCEIGDLHYNEWNCQSCLGTGLIATPDTKNRERAGFIREQVRRATHERADGHTRTPNRVELELWQGLLPSYRLPPDWLISFRIDDTGEWGASDRGAVIHRGFVARIHGTAAEFLQHVDALIWHPEQKVCCGSCGGDYANWKCTDCDRGRVSRPCPDTAQPITKVVLTTAAPLDSIGGVPHMGWMGWAEYSRITWPGVEFEFPEILDWVGF